VHEVLDHVVAHADAAPVFECRLRHADGAWRHIEMVIRNLLDDDAVRGIVINYRDVTERKELEARLRHQALHDPLTALANRDLFYDRVNHALAQRRRSGGLIGVVYVDLDNFKNVNDALGHAAGDRLLEAAAMRLRTTTRRGDTCARLGGDEFGVLLTGLSGEEDAHEAAERILSALADVVDSRGEPLHVDASAGVAIARGSETADEVIGNADLAMYRAKHMGRGRYEMFEPAMRAAVHERVTLRTDLEHGITAGEFVPYYQPIVELASRSVVGVEALVRWHHPGRGVLTPDEFMEVAEHTGAAIAIGEAVLRQTCRDVQPWRNEFDVPLRACVNMSTAELMDPGLRDRVNAVLAETGMAPQRLTIEITEHALASEAATVRDELRFMTDLGARIIVDDFGAGDSPLVLLERHPVHAIKIAGAFTERLGDRSPEPPLIGGIISLGQSLDLHVSAQNVTSAAQAARLQDLGCGFAQGPYLATPRPADTIPLLLRPGMLAERLAPHGAGGWEPIDTPSRTAQ
jgi:diguanylate cyclase (GGDEF)-like protein